MPKRVKYIDTAKGIAIISVVLSHSYSTNHFITQLINSFHMPFFFIISGILYGLKHGNYPNMEFRISKKISALIVPYFIWGTLYQLFIHAFQIVGGKSIKESIFEIVHSLFTLSSGAMWFLPSLFISVTLFLLTSKNKYANIAISIAVMLIGLFAPSCNVLVTAILRAFVGTGFIAIGYYCYNLFIKSQNGIFVFLICLVDIFIIKRNGSTAMVNRTFGNPILYTWSGILGSYILLQICIHLKKENRAICYLQSCGAKSSIILCLHMFIIEIVRFADYKLFGNILPVFSIFEGFVLTLLTMVILTPFLSISNGVFRLSFGISTKTQQNKS